MKIEVECFQTIEGQGNPLALLNGIQRRIHDASGNVATSVREAPREITYTKKGAILTVYGDEPSLELLLDGIIGAHLRARLYGGETVTVVDGELELLIRLKREAEKA